MVKIKEIYLWIVFFGLVIAGAVYLRYYYQPSLSLSVSFTGNSGGTFYPYQQVRESMSVRNTGTSEISNLTFGLYLNNNLTRTYRMTIPVGKAAEVNFNFTPRSSGTYTVSLIGDPNKLYNIQDRSSAQASVYVDVARPQADDPQTLFSSNGLIGEDRYNMTTAGYGFALFLFNNTGANQFALTQSQKINDLIYPVIDVYYSYITDIAIAHAYYNGSSLVSIWLSGPLNASSIAAVAIGKGLNVTSKGNVTVINFGANTTMCVWYSEGWLKSLGAINSSCIKDLGVNSQNSIESLSEAPFVYKNQSVYNYTGFYNNYTYTGQWSTVNDSFLFQSVEKGINFTNVCYGSILNLSNVSYCNTYYIEPQNTIMVKTNALVGRYNLTTWALTANLVLSNQTHYDVNLIKRYNATGPSATFVSGYVNSCYISQDVGCYGAAWNYSILNLGLINEYNSSVFLQSIGCYINGTIHYTPINQTLAPGGYTYLSTECYNNGTTISGIPLGLDVHLNLKLLVNNYSTISEGYAKLVS